MFDRFKPLAKQAHEPGLTSLDLRTEPASQPQPVARPAQEVQPNTLPARNLSCLQLTINPEAALALFKDFRRRDAEWRASGQKPQVVFYAVFPQQGYTVTSATKDGKKTIVPLFGSTWIAKAYLAGLGLKAVIAACRLDALAEQADKWTAAGINCYGLNPCFRCGSFAVYPIAELQSEEQFLEAWGHDAVTRRLFAEIMVRNCQNQLAANPRGVRDVLERVRDHLDCGVPYLHWVIAVLAGLAGDMQGNAAAIQRLEEFGPDFAGKLKSNSCDAAEPGSQMATMPEAWVGLLASYGILNRPTNPAAA